MSRTLRKRWIWENDTYDSRPIEAREKTCKNHCGCKSEDILWWHMQRRRNRYEARAQIREQLESCRDDAR